jgi:hypothetical protein
MNGVSFSTTDIATEGTLLARYQTSDGPRDVMGFNADGEIALFDVGCPSTEGSALYIDCGFFWEESLRSVVLDYVEQSEHHGVPAASIEVSAELVESLELGEVELLLAGGRGG